MATRRALHFVFKIGDRAASIKFFKDVLGMKVLRHEEFTEGCLATCNGPYDGRWSKTMIGYGPEDEHFVMELTYNYGVSNYKLGNDFQGITIKSKEAVENAKRLNWPTTEEEGLFIVTAPGGYKFHLLNESQSVIKDPVEKVCLSTSNLKRSIDYWNGLCKMKIYDQKDKEAILGYDDNQCKLELIEIAEPIDHAKAYGRIAFSCPSSELPSIEAKMKENNETILTPLVSLDTPGKATVQVVILADPDGHEICFVGDEAFKELSQFDPKGDELLSEAMTADKSNEWFAKKGLSKAEG